MEPTQPPFTPPQPPVPAKAPKAKLDLSGLEPPADLAESTVEETTIDGICGVY